MRALPRTDDRTLLFALAAHVHLADAVSTAKAFDAEVEQLERAASEERQKRWRELTREGQVRWLSLLVAWAKALEEDGARLGERTTRVAATFRDLRSFSMNHNPGFVHGFARAVAPKSMTWRTDAVFLLQEIRPERERVRASGTEAVGPVRGERDEDEEDGDVHENDDDEPEADALSEWPYLHRVRGLRVALFGGEVREERRVALERAFQFESLEWVPHNRPRQVASLAARAAHGTVDFVLVTKFVSHTETEALARSTRTPILTMRQGYGVATVCQVFEEYFSRGDDKASGGRNGTN